MLTHVSQRSRIPRGDTISPPRRTKGIIRSSIATNIHRRQRSHEAAGIICRAELRLRRGGSLLAYRRNQTSRTAFSSGSPPLRMGESARGPQLASRKWVPRPNPCWTVSPGTYPRRAYRMLPRLIFCISAVGLPEILESLSFNTAGCGRPRN